MDEARKGKTRQLGKRRMNWKNRLRRAEKDVDDNDEDDDENDDSVDYRGVLNWRCGIWIGVFKGRKGHHTLRLNDSAT